MTVAYHTGTGLSFPKNSERVFTKSRESSHSPSLFLSVFVSADLCFLCAPKMQCQWPYCCKRPYCCKHYETGVFHTKLCLCKTSCWCKSKLNQTNSMPFKMQTLCFSNLSTLEQWREINNRTIMYYNWSKHSLPNTEVMVILISDFCTESVLEYGTAAESEAESTERRCRRTKQKPTSRNWTCMQGFQSVCEHLWTEPEGLSAKETHILSQVLILKIHSTNRYLQIY